MADSNKHRAYLEREWECPVCHKKSIHYWLKKDAVTILARDKDQYAREYKWTQQSNQALSLHNFYLWHCKFCLYTDEREAFFKKNVAKNKLTLEAIRANLLPLTSRLYGKEASDDRFINIAKKHIRYPGHDTLQSLLIHQLALYLHINLNQLHPNDALISRIALRLSWIFREVAEPLSFETMPDFLNAYRTNMQDITLHLQALSSSLSTQRELFKKHLGNTDPCSWEFLLRDYADSIRSTFRMCDRAAGTLENCVAAVEEIDGHLEMDGKQNKTKIISIPFSGYDRFQTMLKELADIWALTPVSEVDAVRIAADYLRKSINRGDYSQGDFTYIGAHGLLMELNLKIDSPQTALEHCEVFKTYLVRLQSKARRQAAGLGSNNQKTKRLTPLLDRIALMLQEIVRNREALNQLLPEVEAAVEPEAETEPTGQTEDEEQHKSSWLKNLVNVRR